MVDILNINSSISIFNSKIDAFELEIKIENYNIYDIISILINNRKIISTISEKISRLRFNIYMIWTSFLIKWQNFKENSLFPLCITWSQLSIWIEWYHSEFLTVSHSYRSINWRKTWYFWIQISKVQQLQSQDYPKMSNWRHLC